MIGSPPYSTLLTLRGPMGFWLGTFGFLLLEALGFGFVQATVKNTDANK